MIRLKNAADGRHRGDLGNKEDSQGEKRERMIQRQLKRKNQGRWFLREEA